ncbi:phosphotransferase, partial [Chloroflexota bacterium]
MTSEEIVSGLDQAWRLSSKIGEGDAGEVFIVKSLLEDKIAVLKRPSRSAFTSDILRQASQIEREARVLRALTNLDLKNSIINTPRLLDTSKAGPHEGERYFIVMTPAPGFDLTFLARCARFGNVPTQEQAFKFSAEEQAFLSRLAKTGKIPDLIILESLSSLIEFLENIHTLGTSTTSNRHFGIIWNDIKPEHFFWDPINSHFTIIDWGNSLFLNIDGVTEDRQFSRIHDYSQLIKQLGAFIQSEKPDLFKKLDWPEHKSFANLYTHSIKPLKERIHQYLNNENQLLQAALQEQRNIDQIESPGIDDFKNLDQLHKRLVGFGALPDHSIARRLIHRLIENLVKTGDLPAIQKICHKSKDFPTLEPTKWGLLEKISHLKLEGHHQLTAINHGLHNDWPNSLWVLRQASLHDSQPDWWEELSSAVRLLHLQLNPDAITPLVALNRLIHTLHASSKNQLQPKEKAKYEIEKEELLIEIKNDLLIRWCQIEPDPPDSDIDYKRFEKIRDRIIETEPDAGQTLVRALIQPKAQVQIVLDAWGNLNFDTARSALRSLFIWDPDRLRVFTTDQALSKAQEWLREVE